MLQSFVDQFRYNEITDISKPIGIQGAIFRTQIAGAAQNAAPAIPLPPIGRFLDDDRRKIYSKFCISMEDVMQVSRWGNSLAIRLPASVVEALELKEGDEVEVHVAGDRAFDIARDRSRERALERIRALAKTLPPDWKFDREDANAR
jgi:antitoxin MazE